MKLFTAFIQPANVIQSNNPTNTFLMKWNAFTSKAMTVTLIITCPRRRQSIYSNIHLQHSQSYRWVMLPKATTTFERKRKYTIMKLFKKLLFRPANVIQSYNPTNTFQNQWKEITSKAMKDTSIIFAQEEGTPSSQAFISSTLNTNDSR